MASGDRYQLPSRCRWHLDALHHPLHIADAAGGSGKLEGNHASGSRIYDRVSRSRDNDDWHVRLARHADVLSVLRRRADPDVHHHRCLGRRAARLCRFQVLPLHASRFGADACLHAGDVYRCRHNRHSGPDSARFRGRYADMAVPRLPCVIRGEGADVAGSHLASRRACRGTDGRLDDPCRCAAENGRIRVYPLLAADVPAGVGILRPADLRAVDHRDCLHIAGCACAVRHEEADRLFLGGAYGVCYHWHLHPDRAGRCRRDVPDDQPRSCFGGAVFLCWRCV